MRVRTAMTIVLIIVTAELCAASQSPAVVTCPRLEAPPTIDGQPEEGEWARAATLPPLVRDRGGMPRQPTTVRVGFDDRALYLTARMHDRDPAGARTLATTGEDQVAEDDAITLFIDRNLDGTSVVELSVNAAGTEYSAIDGRMAPTVPWRSRTQVEEDAWVVEMAYEFGADGPPRSGDVWGFNLRRNAPRDRERSSMSGGAAAGRIRFEQPPITLELESIGDPWYGSNTVGSRVRNLADHEQMLKVNARVSGPTRRAHSFEVSTLTIAGGETRTLQVPYTVPRGGRCSLQVSAQTIRGEQATTAFRTPQMGFELPALGAAIDEALSDIAGAYVAYVMMSEERRPFEGASQLDMLVARWRYLDSQHRQRSGLTLEAVVVLLDRVRSLSQDAILMEQRFAELASEG